MTTPSIPQFPLISCTQKIVIYETQARYYVVGSNNTETRFRVLKIDRTEPRDLVLIDDKIEYSRREIRNLLLMINVGNQTKAQQKSGNGLVRTVLAFGIVGFVRFLEGYYFVLITKRRRVALIGPHTIYKIEDTSLVYIPNDSVRQLHPDESRYIRIFQNVDLSSNFYFSYSYDLTHSLQYNLTPCQGLEPDQPTNPAPQEVHFWQSSEHEAAIFDTESQDDNDVEDASKSALKFLDEIQSTSKKGEMKEFVHTEATQPEDPKEWVYGIRVDPTWKYVWNKHLLQPACEILHPEWILHVTHGFVGQSNIKVYGKSVLLTLIARRSNQFAGTRFLKRGANSEGSVANDVETEQIIQDASVSGVHQARFTSFVQLRGSLPVCWSQDVAKMVPKPQIMLDQADPYGFVAGQHFNQVLRRYGSPAIILNLVKKHEKKRHESMLTEEVVKAVTYLNQFLIPEHSIKYIGFDMARVSKNKSSNVLIRLAEIAEYCMKKTGFFQSRPDLVCNEMRPHIRCKGLPMSGKKVTSRQRGIVRTNCVDCLDRTNTAQFALAKCAMAFQLHAMGIIDVPVLDFDTDCVRMLEDLYEDHGDTLALQYGGSQLVHRIKSYRKAAPWTSSSRDIMQTLSRYYSNAFSDSEKQQAINLFLGVYEPGVGHPNIWELPTDFYLHNPVTLKGPVTRDRNYCQWWESEVVNSLPAPYDEESKGLAKGTHIIKTQPRDERVDGYWEYYRPYALTSLDELFCYHMPTSTRDFMPKSATCPSPFALRVRPGRRQEEHGNLESNPNICGKDSTLSITSTGSDGSTSSSDGSDIDGDIEILDNCDLPKEDSSLSLVSLKDLFPTMAQTYGVEIFEPEKRNTTTYKKYVQIGHNATEPLEDIKRAATNSTELIQKSMFALDSSYNVEPPTVNSQSKDVYQTYLRRGAEGGSIPSKRDAKVYQQYLFNNYL